MKKLVVVFLLSFAFSTYSQIPQSFKYQAIARDATGKLLENTTIGIRLSILQGNTSGPSVYTETHTTSTNQFGLVVLDIGKGIDVSGNFSAIQWSSNHFFLKVEMDASGGSNYLEIGISEFVAVPYAIHSQTTSNFNETDPVFSSYPAKGITESDTSRWNAAYIQRSPNGNNLGDMQ